MEHIETKTGPQGNFDALVNLPFPANPVPATL